jgi:hypothetical protein
MVVRLAALPYLTSGLANVLGTLTYNSYITGGIGWWAMVAASISYFGALMAVALRDRHDPAIWLLLSGLAIGAASFGGGMIAVDPYQWFSVGAGERYNFLPAGRQIPPYQRHLGDADADHRRDRLHPADQGYAQWAVLASRGRRVARGP